MMQKMRAPGRCSKRRAIYLVRLALWGWTLTGMLALSLAPHDAVARSHRSRKAKGDGENAAEKTTSAAATTESSEADSAVAQARTATDAHDYATATRLLTQAYRAAPSPILLHALAGVAIAEGRTVEAQDLLRRVLADSSLDGSTPLRAQAQEALSKLPSVDAGEVSVSAPRGATVELDGRLVGIAPLTAPLLVASGPHRVLVTAGKWHSEANVTVRTARLSELRFKSGADLAVVTLPAAILHIDDFRGAGVDAAHDALTQAVVASLKRENYALLQRQTALTYGKDVTACAGEGASKEHVGEPCYKALATRFSVDHVLVTQVTRDEQGFRFDLSLYDVRVGDTAATSSANCAACSVDQAAGRLGEAVLQVLTNGSGRARGSLAVTSTPPGAEVRLGSRLLGITPLEQKLWAGSYQLAVTRTTHRPYTQTVEVKTDETTRVEAPLGPENAIPDAAAVARAEEEQRRAREAEQAATRKRWLMVGVGAGGIGVGALLLGFGISALAANGNCAVPQPDPAMGATMCRRVYDTAAPGGALVGVGSALMIGGAVLIALPSLQARRR